MLPIDRTERNHLPDHTFLAQPAALHTIDVVGALGAFGGTCIIAYASSNTSPRPLSFPGPGIGTRVGPCHCFGASFQ